MAGRGNNKSPKHNEPASSKKVPRAVDANAYLKACFRWTFDDFVREEVWGHTTTLNCLLNDILPKLVQFLENTWSEIVNNKHHYCEITDSPNAKEATKLLKEAGETETEMFSLRLDGQKRIWGIRDQARLRIIWYDPFHRVWPSEKKHT